MAKAIKHNENGVEVFFIVSDELEVISSIKPKATGSASSVIDDLSNISNGMNYLIDTITNTCNKVEAKMKEINKQKDSKSGISELTLEFGLSLTAEAGVVFTKAKGEATVKVIAKFDFK